MKKRPSALWYLLAIALIVASPIIMLSVVLSQVEFMEDDPAEYLAFTLDVEHQSATLTFAQEGKYQIEYLTAEKLPNGSFPDVSALLVTNKITKQTIVYSFQYPDPPVQPYTTSDGLYSYDLFTVVIDVPGDYDFAVIVQPWSSDKRVPVYGEYVVNQIFEPSAAQVATVIGGVLLMFAAFMGGIVLIIVLAILRALHKQPPAYAYPPQPYPPPPYYPAQYPPYNPPTQGENS
ncbi:MAG: hypothetical protein LBN05_05340 [Oscillospiraceae bacterium]|jgi:hypothetical protein|nr:hypothetical protein [Oscillospiraceae bacterium]